MEMSDENNRIQIFSHILGITTLRSIHAVYINN